MLVVKQALYRLGRWLMHKNYVPGCNAVEHDLRVEVAELRKLVSQYKIAAAVRKARGY